MASFFPFREKTSLSLLPPDLNQALGTVLCVGIPEQKAPYVRTRRLFNILNIDTKHWYVMGWR